MKCPRRDESFMSLMPREDDYDPTDDSCAYCGSLNPDTFMARLEAGTASLTPTDKSYKVYITNEGGEPFKQSFRDCYAKDANGQMIFDGRKTVMKEPECHGPEDCTHWVTRERNETKFYFRHLSEPQMIRFIELMNAGKLVMKYPGYFYVTPFFIQLGPKP